MSLSLYVGYDPREADAYDVCVHSVKKRASLNVPVLPIKIDDMRARGLYTRPTEKRGHRLWDVLSEAPMSTEFAITRFLTPHLARTDAKTDWAIFCDCDFLWLDDIANLYKLADPKYAVMCVKHQHIPPESTKMDDQLQLLYARKNWSSLMMWNVNHPATQALTLEMINSLPGRDLHRFCWLKDDEIGGLPITWNWLEGHNKMEASPPSIVHYTRGGPWFDHMMQCDYAKEWLDEFADMKKAVA